MLSFFFHSWSMMVYMLRLSILSTYIYITFPILSVVQSCSTLNFDFLLISFPTPLIFFYASRITQCSHPSFCLLHLNCLNHVSPHVMISPDDVAFYAQFSTLKLIKPKSKTLQPLLTFVDGSAFVSTFIYTAHRLTIVSRANVIPLSKGFFLTSFMIALTSWAEHLDL